MAWWRHQMETFSSLLAIWRGILRSPVNSPHKGQWHRALMLSLICVLLNGWVNNREAGDLRRNWAHYDVIVMGCLLWVQICQHGNPHIDALVQERHNSSALAMELCLKGMCIWKFLLISMMFAKICCADKIKCLTTSHKIYGHLRD